MAATRQDFTLWTGDSLTLEIAVADGAGDPVDLDGATFEWELWAVQRNAVYQPFKGDGSLIRKATGDGITAAGGVVSVVLTPADSEDLPGGLYYHELQMTQGSTVTTPTTGQATLIKTAIPTAS